MRERGIIINGAIIERLCARLIHALDWGLGYTVRVSGSKDSKASYGRYASLTGWAKAE